MFLALKVKVVRAIVGLLMRHAPACGTPRARLLACSLRPRLLLLSCVPPACAISGMHLPCMSLLYTACARRGRVRVASVAHQCAGSLLSEACAVGGLLGRPRWGSVRGGDDDVNGNQSMAFAYM